MNFDEQLRHTCRHCQHIDVAVPRLHGQVIETEDEDEW